ncbi:MAG: hypothetical protein WC356_06815 [Candidatus Micrarchaeia archaeon]|jgi:hypothetical protein
MKIVINKCFGGFGLSRKAIQDYLKRKHKKAYFYTNIKDGHLFEDENHKTLYRRDLDDEDSIFFHVTTKDMGDSFTDDELNSMPNKCYFSFYDIDRTDKDLIAVIELLGHEANTQFSDLKVVEIPDNIEWEIDEYDGRETINETHQSWG